MDRVTIFRRETAFDIELQPGEYRPSKGIAWAIVRCPKCKLLSSTSRRLFHVDYEGDITPTVKCPHCKFEALVHFEGWVPEPEGLA